MTFSDSQSPDLPHVEDAKLTPYERMIRARFRAKYIEDYYHKLLMMRLIQVWLFEQFQQILKEASKIRNNFIENDRFIFREELASVKFTPNNSTMFKASSSENNNSFAIIENNLSQSIGDRNINKNLDTKDYNIKTMLAINGIYPNTINSSGELINAHAKIFINTAVVVEFTSLFSSLSKSYDPKRSLEENIELELLLKPNSNGYSNILSVLMAKETHVIHNAIASRSVYMTASPLIKLKLDKKYPLHKNHPPPHNIDVSKTSAAMSSHYKINPPKPSQ